MNIFHKVALQGMKKNRTQTLVTIVGVILSAALFTGVATFAVSLQSYLVNGAAEKYGAWHIQLPAADAASAIAHSTDQRLADTTVLQNIGYAALEGGKNGAKPYLFLSGWDQKAFDTLPLQLIAGRLPENSDEVLIPAHLAANGGVKLPLGSTITLTVGDRVSIGDSAALSQHTAYTAGQEVLALNSIRTFTVVGICQRPAIEEFQAPGYTLITAADPAVTGSVAAFLTLKNPYQLPAYLESLPKQSCYVLNDDLLRFLGLSSEKLFTTLLCVVVAILVLLVVIGSVFLIYNAFQMSLNERTHQFGILMSVGATARQLRHTVLFEGLCIGAVGIPLGILLGLPSVRLVLLLVEKNFNNVMYDGVPLALVISVPAIVAAAVLSLVTILISAYLPAKKAAATPIMECIRQTNELKLNAKRLRTAPLAEKLCSLEQLLALKNFKRNRRRYRSVVLSLTFSVVLFVAASTFGGYLNQLAESSQQVVEQYDIVFTSSQLPEDQLLPLYEQLRQVSDITVSGYQAQVSYGCSIGADQLSQPFLDTFGPFLSDSGDGQSKAAVLDAVFVDDAAYQRLLASLQLPADAYSGQTDSMLLASYVEGNFYWQEPPMTVSLSDADGNAVKTVQVTFVNDYPDLLPADAGDPFRGYSLLLIGPYSAKAQFDDLHIALQSKLGITFQSANPGQSTAQMQTILDANGVTADYELYNLYAILEQNRNLTFIINLFAAVFILMISLIAIVNVFNTISTNIKLRRRELAMLRSVGMSDRAFRNMLCFECVLYGLRTLLYGVPLSLLCAWLIYQGIAAGIIAGTDLTMQLPWHSLAIGILGVFVIIVITMLYAARKVKQENIIDALRDDMT